MYGSSMELIFAGHINDKSNDDLLAFLDQAGFLLVDKGGEYPRLIERRDEGRLCP